MKRRILAAFGVALCFLLTACVVDSENPLAVPESAKIDQRLVGDWLAKNGDVVHFAAKDEHWMTSVTTPKDTSSSDKKPEPDVFFVTAIGDETYFNIRTAGKDSKGHSSLVYLIYRYKITPDQRLHLWPLSQDAMEEAVHAGKIKGTVHDNGTTGNPPKKDVDVHLTDSSENLAKFISRHDPADIFDDESDPLVKVATKGD